jgi:hypothetical protein
VQAGRGQRPAPGKADRELVTEDDGAVGERDLEHDEKLESYGVVAMAGSRRA